jgi:hypothetical protein
MKVVLSSISGVEQLQNHNCSYGCIWLLYCEIEYFTSWFDGFYAGFIMGCSFCQFINLDIVFLVTHDGFPSRMWHIFASDSETGRLASYCLNSLRSCQEQDYASEEEILTICPCEWLFISLESTGFTKGFMMPMPIIINAVNVYVLCRPCGTRVQHLGAVGLQQQIPDMCTWIAKQMFPTNCSDCYKLPQALLHPTQFLDVMYVQVLFLGEEVILRHSVC